MKIDSAIFLLKKKLYKYRLFKNIEVEDPDFIEDYKNKNIMTLNVSVWEDGTYKINEFI